MFLSEAHEKPKHTKGSVLPRVTEVADGTFTHHLPPQSQTPA